MLSFVRALPLDVWSTAMLVESAVELADARRLSVNDACYAALAEAQGAVLVTADRRLAAAVPRAELVSKRHEGVTP